MRNTLAVLLMISTMTVEHSARAQHRDVAEILGATHMNPLYSFTATEPVLKEGSDVLKLMGSSAIKLWFGPDYATDNYPQNHSWPTVSSLTGLAQTSYFQNLFADTAFKTYSLQAATFNYRNGWQYGDFSAAESNAVYNEIYDLTAHLLSTYNNSGKTFIIQNWEGDNALGQNASAQLVQNMIDWLNCRQSAIDAAVADLPASNVWVYGAAECNKVGDPGWSGARCVTDVFPYLHMDLYSYSDWYTRFSEAKLLEDLNNIKRFAPDSAAFGHENVMLGEFGLNRMLNSEADNFTVSRTEYEIGMDVGARFAFYWCVYEQADTNQSHGMVLNAERAGLFGLPVDETGRYYSLTHNYFKTNSLMLDIYEDQVDDFSLCSSYSNLTVVTTLKDQLDNDPSRFVRMDGAQSGILEYSLDSDVRRLAITGFEEPGNNNQVWVYASQTGETGSYISIQMRRVINSVYPGNTYRRVLNKNVNEIPPGYRYFRIIISGDVQWSPQISAVRFYYERPPIIKTIQFGGVAWHLTDASHQMLIGADELIQWNGVDNWGASFGANGTLNNKGTNKTLSSPAMGLQLISTGISSTAPAGTNTVTSGGVLGIKGGDNSKFDSDNAEQWAFGFDRAVVLKHLILSALDNDNETAEVTINGETWSFDRTVMSSAGWGVKRHVYNFDPPVELAAGTEVRIAPTEGQWGLEGVVVRAGELATPYDLWTDIQEYERADAEFSADPDGNGQNNLLDYALDWTPPTYGVAESGGSNAVEYIYRRRRDAAARGLTYNVEWTGNLVSNVWSSAGVSEAGFEVLDVGFESVTNRIPTDLPQKFIHLGIDVVE